MPKPRPLSHSKTSQIINLTIRRGDRKQKRVSTPVKKKAGMSALRLAAVKRVDPEVDFNAGSAIDGKPRRYPPGE